MFEYFVSETQYNSSSIGQETFRCTEGRYYKRHGRAVYKRYRKDCTRNTRAGETKRLVNLLLDEIKMQVLNDMIRKL